MSNAPVSALSDTRVRYERDGFLVVRHVFGPDRIAALAAEAERLRQRTDLIDTNNIRCRWQNDVDHGRVPLRLLRSGDRPERRLRTAPPAIRALLDVVGADAYGEPACLFKDKLIFKSPGTLGYKLHQDYISLEVVSDLVPDGDRRHRPPPTPQSGATEVFPGYHQQGCLTARGWQVPPSARRCRRSRDAASILDLAPGDIALFSGFTPHRSASNAIDTLAPAALSELQRASATAASGASVHYAEFRGWLQDRTPSTEDVDLLPVMAEHASTIAPGSALGDHRCVRPAGSTSSSRRS